VTWSYVIIGTVALQRILELIYSARNARALRARGAIEVGVGHYPLLVAVHVAWIVALFVSVNAETAIYPVWLALYVLLQLGRTWVLLTLGRYWTTRLFHLESVPTIQSGPYRFLRHPNYLVVVGEIATLPLVFGLWHIAVIFSLLNGAVLLWRIRIENRFLDRRPHGDVQYVPDVPVNPSEP
jgi:methyltransferase